MKIRCGIIGFGMSAKTFHIPFIDALDEYELSAVSTSRETELRESHPQARHYADPLELIADPDLDLIIITSPNESHYRYAEAVINAGRHAVVEKPFTVSARDARRLAEMAKRSDRMLTVFHSRRWDADFRTLQEILSAGKLGTLSHFESHYDRFRPTVRDRWREKAQPGAGLLYDLGSHLLDQAVCLFGSPEWLWADVVRQRPGAQTDDYVHIILAYGPFRAEIHIGSFVNGPLPRFAVHGEKGSFIKYGMDPQEDRLKAGENPTKAGFGAEDERNYGTLYPAPEGSAPQVIPSIEGSYADFYRSLARALNKEGAVPVQPEDAALVIRLIEAAEKSADTGRRITL
jgi:scyllo-inositol 2-dehydrogenase (NADP+)